MADKQRYLYEVDPGMHIEAAIQEAIALSREHNQTVEFKFNEVLVLANADDQVGPLFDKWSKDLTVAQEAWVNSPEYKEREAKRESDRIAAEAAEMKETAVTEEALRDAKVPTPLTPKQLADYIESLVHRDHDYGSCVYAMSMAATAAFNYVAHVLGVTGFQASCADLDILKRTRNLDGPFKIIKGEDMLYPQYNIQEKVEEALEKWKPWAKEQAQKLLDEHTGADTVHPDVRAHWEKIASLEVEKEEV